MSKQLVLFISPAFFGYEISIKNAIEENGYEVDYFDERPSNSALMKALVRTQKKAMDVLISRYFNEITEKIKAKKYDYFLLIKGEVIPESFILNFRINNPMAKLIYYTYDATNNNSLNGIRIQEFFDKCYSIDFVDVEKNAHLKLKHLFYSKEFKLQPEDNTNTRTYDISFVGTLHSNRYKVMKYTFEKFENSFLFLYSPAKWWFLYNKIFNKDYKEIKWSSVSFKKINLKQVASIFKASGSVLDVQRYGQAGLTMRTFEVLASGAVLITTNSRIVDADFYDENRIVIIKDEITQEKVNEIKYKILNKNKLSNSFEKYFVNNWVKEFFETDNE